MVSKEKECIGFIGAGRLYQAVWSYLEEEYELVSIESVEELALRKQAYSLILYCADQWHFQTQQQINQQCLTLDIPWLRAYCEFGIGIIGPCVDPKEAGCVACVETRRRASMRDATDFVLLCQQNESTQRTREQPWLASYGLELLAQLVVQEVCTYLNTPDRVQTRRASLYLDLDTLHCQKHRFLPEPECPACGRILPDTAEAAIITLQSRPKLSPSTYRTRSLKAHAKEIFETYVDTKTGLIPVLIKDPHFSAMVTAWIGTSNGRESYGQMNGTGRTLNYEQSQLAAIAEALERYGGQRPKTKRTSIHASYRELLVERALDPTTLGLHTIEQYALPGFRYIPYHPDLPCSWVWGYSFQQQAPILVPKHIAYYGWLRLGTQTANADVGARPRYDHPADPEQTAFVYEISNGCALGNCLEEAIFHGILEVAERDAFLLTWYAQLSVPRIDPRSATDPEISLMLESIESASGYTIHVFNTTLDHGVPCCWVMAVDEQDRDGMPKALCAAGSHPNPEQAVLNALQELEMMVKRPFGDFQAQRQKALEMLFDPLAVTAMEHHSLLYYLPEAFERLSFLYDSPRLLQTFQEAFPAVGSARGTGSALGTIPIGMDLRDDLTALIDHYLARGIDVIVVDQTTPEHAAQDFRCVKVIMPGMLPMTFGHQHRRNTDFQRLYHLPAQLGYRDGPLTDADINPHPHPFP
jgi:ribosomal protein S12 methylthiotransferase accessory factor